MAGTVSAMASTTAVCALSAPALSSSQNSVHGSGFASVTSGGSKAPVASTLAVRCRINAEQAENDMAMSRRSAFSLLAAVGALGFSRVSPAIAAYGEGANIFGSPKVDTGFTAYAGDGFTFNLPAKWNPSKEVEFPGQVLRYEDNFDPLTNLSVSIRPSDKRSIKEYGSPESFLKTVSYLLGKQSFKGPTRAEGGFDPNYVSTASIFKAEEADVKGKSYYYLAILTRTGDGTEGGRHQYIVGTVAGGKLYIFKAQAGDKRWFKGTSKYVEGAASSFTVA